MTSMKLMRRDLKPRSFIRVLIGVFLACLLQDIPVWAWLQARFFGKLQLTLAEPAAGSKPPELTSSAAAFFEKQIRPVLVDNCFSCHGEAMQMAGLRLDSQAAIMKGRDNGRVVLIPGDP